MLVISLVLFGILALLIVEARLLKQSVHRIQHRIHVNGTRGKSTLTAYLAAALDDDARHTLAKITGVVPTLIHNGRSSTIFRTGGARIQEQFRTMHYAARKKCHTLVLECMSIDPALQKLESRVFEPTIYILTNIRDDHREALGSSEAEQVRALCEAIPSNAKVITGHSSHLEAIARAVAQKNSQLFVADQGILHDIDMELPPGTFPENMAMALTACKLLDIEKDNAFQRIRKFIGQQDSRLSCLDTGRDILFLNGFDINDTESADLFMKQWSSEFDRRKKVILFNTRADRPLRTELFAQWLVGLPDLDKVLISGNHRKRALKILHRAGFEREQIREYNPRSENTLKHDLLEAVEDHSLILAIGNIAGQGFKILKALK